MHLTLTLACGPDEILARVLKEQAPSIAPWLSSMFRNSYHTGAVPLTGIKPWLQLFVKRIQSQTLLIIALFLLLPYVVRLWNTLF